ELPGLLEAERGAARNAARGAPAIDVRLRPEGEHGRSGVADVVPPVPRGNGKVRDPLGGIERPVRDAERHLLAAVAAGSEYDAAATEHRNDPEGVPDAGSPVRASRRLDPKRRRERRERVRHPDVARTGGEHEDVALLEPAERCFDLGGSDREPLRDLV